MPIAVPVTYEGHSKIQENLESKGFWEASEKERVEILMQMKGYIEVPEFGYPSCSGETCFLYRFGKYLVVVWTSCLREKVFECRRQEKKARSQMLLFNPGEVVSRPNGEDAGRVLILEETRKGRKFPRYFARYVHRTKGFVRNLCRRAWIAAYKISHRPKCERCGEPMDICETDAGGNHWGCFNWTHFNALIKDPFFRDWHYGLPEKSQKMCRALDRAFKKQLYRRCKEAEEQGKKPPERAFVIRGRAKAKRAAA